MNPFGAMKNGCKVTSKKALMKTNKVRFIRIAALIGWFCTAATLLSTVLPNENSGLGHNDFGDSREKVELWELGIVSTVTVGLTIAAIAEHRKKN